MAMIVVAGLVAGLVLGVFHWVATEPVIEQAIAIEEMSHSEAAEPVVSRDVQRVGLVVGSALYGLIFSAFFGVAYVVLRGRRWLSPGWPAIAMLGFAAFWALALFPTLKYPANPPGVGDPESITFRQTAFIACWILSILGVAVSAALGSRLERFGAPRVATMAIVAVMWFAGLYLLLPANPDPMTTDPELVQTFRVRSVAGLFLFWIVLSGAFGAMVNRPTAAGARRSPLPV
jgi:predicted cobalt transporter CbtA